MRKHKSHAHSDCSCCRDWQLVITCELLRRQTRVKCLPQEDIKAQCKATLKVTTLAGRVRWFRRIGEGGGAQSLAAVTWSALGLSLLPNTARVSEYRCISSLPAGYRNMLRGLAHGMPYPLHCRFHLLSLGIDDVTSTCAVTPADLAA